MNEDLILIKRLEYLRSEHQALDNRIDHEALDEFTKQRLKRERLILNDQIHRLEHMIYPDIIA
jgi:hypothetical protein